MIEQEHETKKKNRERAYIMARRILDYFSPRVCDEELQLEALDEDASQYFNPNDLEE